MEIWNAITSMPMPVLCILVLVIIITTIYIAYQHAKLKGLNGLRVQLYQYMIIAEHNYLSGEGRQKLKYVVSKARQLLPDWMRFFITDDALMHLVEMWFGEIKDLLDDGKINESEKISDPESK